MSRQSIREYFRALYPRYRQGSKEIKKQILDQVCATTHYHRKYAIRLFNGPLPPKKDSPASPRKRKPLYGSQTLSLLTSVWKTADYPCSVRLKALLPLWWTWIVKQFHPSSLLQQQLLKISPRQMDRRLQHQKTLIRKGLYGRTKPGTLLKHQIPIQTDHWDVHQPGSTEVDTVAHCGNSLQGEFAYTVNQTDILTAWTESRAILGKGERAVVEALNQMAQAFPFPIQAIDSDNGSEFINWHLLRYCQKRQISLSRSRPYKKDDNAYIEQKNWTHVRKLLGYARFDSPPMVQALNDLYQNEWRLFMNLFMPSMKLLHKKRIGSRLKRIYDQPQTPLQRLIASGQGDLPKMEALQQLQQTLNPFELSQSIDRKLQKIFHLAHHKPYHPTTPPRPLTSTAPKAKPLTRVEKEAWKTLSEKFPTISLSVRNNPLLQNRRKTITHPSRVTF